MRIGTGYDVHRLVEERKLILGGVEIPYERGLLGHSDADVLTHAVMDALLGALGEGDIGRHFPDSDPQYKGISSMLLLEHVMGIVRAKGYGVMNADVTIVAQKPKLASYIPQMRENIATFNELHPLNEEEKQTLFDVAKAMNLRNTLSCTGCRYCADRCPQELDIPQIVDRYNKKLYTGKLDLSGIREEKLPASCIGCGNCESACPQKIKICQMMEELSKV